MDNLLKLLKLIGTSGEQPVYSVEVWRQFGLGSKWLEQHLCADVLTVLFCIIKVSF